MAEESRERLAPATHRQLQRRLGADVARGFDQGVHNVLVRQGWDVAADGPVRPLNVLNANRQRCDDDVQWESGAARVCRRRRAGPAPCYSALHQCTPIWRSNPCRREDRRACCYSRLRPAAPVSGTDGRLEPQVCKWQARLGLTCRRHPERHLRGPLPPFCEACERWIPLASVPRSWGLF